MLNKLNPALRSALSNTKHIYGPAKKTVVFCNARDELHIKEWAFHHLLIGFDRVVIFDHKSKKPIESVFNTIEGNQTRPRTFYYQALKRIKIINVGSMRQGSGIKMPLMNYAVSIAKGMTADWMIYLDADEFFCLHPKYNNNVKNFLNEYPYAHLIGVNWLMFGSNYLDKEPKPGANENNHSIMESYTKSENKLNPHVKTFVRPYEVLSATNPHFYHIRNKRLALGMNRVNISGNSAINDWKIPYEQSPAYIAHYVQQSLETYIRRKGELPRDDTGTHRAMNKSIIDAHHVWYNDVENTDVKDKYSGRVKSLLYGI